MATVAPARRRGNEPVTHFHSPAVATSLLMIAILLAGVLALRQLPLSALPDVAYPTIQVQTFYPGASPDVITSAVTAPLEKQFGQMSGLDNMSSTSSAGASVITLRFNLSLALDIAEQEVQGRHQRGADADSAGPARPAPSTPSSIRPTRRC